MSGGFWKSWTNFSDNRTLADRPANEKISMQICTELRTDYTRICRKIFLRVSTGSPVLFQSVSVDWVNTGPPESFFARGKSEGHFMSGIQEYLICDVMSNVLRGFEYAGLYIFDGIRVQSGTIFVFCFPIGLCLFMVLQGEINIIHAQFLSFRPREWPYQNVPTARTAIFAGITWTWQYIRLFVLLHPAVRRFLRWFRRGNSQWLNAVSEILFRKCAFYTHS